MMRPALIVLASLAFAAALAGLWVGGKVALPATIMSGVVLVSAIFENWRYRRVSATAPGAGWQETTERFIDPDSGSTVTVFFNPATGERRYVDAPTGPDRT